jgi:hypothetical protein
MSAAATLQEAAGSAFDNLQVWFAISNAQAQARLTQFWGGIISSFPTTDVKSRPIQNWIAVLAAQTTQIPTSPAHDLVALDASAQVVYRLCWNVSDLQTKGFITTTQANAVLGAYNANIATP